MRDSHCTSIDTSLGAMPHELGVIERARNEVVRPGLSLRLCAANDLVILKAFANRTREPQDIRSIMIRGKYLLDREFIGTELSPLAEPKEKP